MNFVGYFSICHIVHTLISAFFSNFFNVFSILWSILTDLFFLLFPFRFSISLSCYLASINVPYIYLLLLLFIPTSSRLTLNRFRYFKWLLVRTLYMNSVCVSHRKRVAVSRQNIRVHRLQITLRLISTTVNACLSTHNGIPDC